MTYQQGIAAGRRDVIAQIERGLDRRRAPSAGVLMVPGPGGSGKKCLLSVVEADTRAELPCARLVLSPAQDVRLAVERVADAMDGFESKRYGTLSLPRVTLLRSLASRVRAEAEPPDDYRRRQLAKDALIGPRTVSGTDAATAAPDLPDPGDGIPHSRIGVFIANLAMRAWRSRRRAALALGRPGRVLAPRRAGVWHWYENYGDRSDDFAGGGVVGFAAAAAREMFEASRGATPDARDSARHRLDRLWVAALVADLFGAYPRRRPYRRLRCLLLLEDADLLVSDDNLSPLTGHPFREAGQGGDLLNLMQTEIETSAGRRTRSPVLIVATQQAAAGHIDGGSTLELLPMTRAQATSFVAATAPQRPLTAWAQEELFDACKGHPLALHLLLEQRDRQRQEVVRPPRAKLALARPQPGGAEPLTEVLLDSFLQRFEPEPTRTEITDLLTLVAIPRRVSVPALRALALDGAPAPSPLFRLLRSYSFTQIVPGADEPTIELDPLMRDLLMRRGHEAGGELAAAVRARRELLRDNALDGANTLDALHHHLALGETDAVAALLACYLVGTWDDELFDEIDDACRAPGAPENPALPSDDDAMAYVLATWALRSCTSTARWSQNRFRDLSRRAAVLGPNTSARLRLTEFAETDVDPNASGSRGRPFRYPPQLLLARRRFLALAVAVPVALASGTVAVEVDSARRWCDLDPVSALTVRFDDRLRLERVGDECIGVTASAVSFSASAREPSPEEREITELATAIEGQNRDAESAQQEPRPIVTIVVATMLSSGGEAGDGSVASGVNELRGALLAQRRANEPSGAISKRFRVRLLLANLGGNSRYATRTAHAIVAHARDDPGIVGVTGMGQTRAETIEAAQILGGAGIPMVGSAPSGDAFENSPYFIRLAPSNNRQAQVIAEVAGTAFPDHRPFLLWDAGADTYSSELKDDMDQAFMERGTGPLRLLGYRAGDLGVPGTIEERLDQLCEETGTTPALLLYAGRANELPTVLEELRTESCNGNVRILGGDDLTQLGTRSFREVLPQELSDKLYYATFGRRVDGPVRPPELVDFAEEYATAEATYPGGFTSGANGHTMLAHDALTLLFDAALATTAPAGAPPSRTDVFPVARATNRRMVTGNVGLVPFGPSPTAGAEVPNKLVVVQEIFSLPAGGYTERELSRGPAAFEG